VTYPKCFTYVAYVWSPQETVDGLLSIGCAEHTVERVEAERKAARGHSTPRGVTIKLD
jgi:hypothetical protein